MSKSIAFLLACVFSFLLFVFMQFLVNGEAQALVVDEPPTDINWEFKIENLDPESQPRPQREPPEPPKLVKQPDSSSSSSKPKRAQPVRVAMRPSLANSDSISYTPGNPTSYFGGEGQFSGDGELAPKVRIEPHYPSTAARDGKEGFVTIVFDINESGATENIRIVEAKPKGVFEKASRQAVRKWRYKPQEENGVATSVKGQKVTLTFRLES